MNSFFTLHGLLEVGKTQDLPSKFWQTLGDAQQSISELMLFFTRFHCQHKTIALQYVTSQLQLADFFTKAQAREQHRLHLLDFLYF
jgi:hypothetical protein